MSKSLSVLVVDDNPSMASTLADILDVKGFEAYTANSGAEALEILRDHPVDILLTDVKMPEMNGVELYRETRKIRPNITAILMTAYAADDLIHQGMTEGTKTVLTKPVDIDFLLSYLSASKMDFINTA
jgi:CheY-like chemotaxis protein